MRNRMSELKSGKYKELIPYLVYSLTATTNIEI